MLVCVVLKLIARSAYTWKDYARAKDLFYMQIEVGAATMVSQPAQKAIGIQLFVCIRRIINIKCLDNVDCVKAVFIF